MACCVPPERLQGYIPQVEDPCLKGGVLAFKLVLGCGLCVLTEYHLEGKKQVWEIGF